ncbi:CIC11C00000001808 [Sungouiella intermedia]|uniref:Reticulon-like protein n=1 Tax=Sungouiella intermedia TaxID=45354 RepID=A0A1L0CUA8_9ASCO|nr:CIC11C00000001808 [[Candida] intermedia]
MSSDSYAAVPPVSSDSFAASQGSSAGSTPITSISPCALLTWQDPVATGKVFGALIGALILFKVNVAPLVFHGLYIGLLVAAAAEYAGKLLTGQGFVTKYLGNRPKSHSQTFRKQVLPAVGDVAGALEAYVHKVAFAQDIESTLKAAGVSYILYKLTSWFSVYSLLIVTVLLAFSFPPFYQANKKEIDAAVAQYTKIVKDKTSEYTALAHKKAAPHLETLSKKSGPLGSFIQSKFPTRTAGSTVNSPTAATTAPVSTSATTKPVVEPATGVSTGSSFPLVPQSAPSGVSEIIEDGQAHATKTHAQLSDL